MVYDPLNYRGFRFAISQEKSLAFCGQNLWDRSPDRELALKCQDHLNREFFFSRMALFPDWSRVPQI